VEVVNDSAFRRPTRITFSSLSPAPSEIVEVSSSVPSALVMKRAGYTHTDGMFCYKHTAVCNLHGPDRQAQRWRCDCWTASITPFMRAASSSPSNAIVAVPSVATHRNPARRNRLRRRRVVVRFRLWPSPTLMMASIRTTRRTSTSTTRSSSFVFLCSRGQKRRSNPRDLITLANAKRQAGGSRGSGSNLHRNGLSKCTTSSQQTACRRGWSSSWSRWHSSHRGTAAGR
jgi:hypothetical protein